MGSCLIADSSPFGKMGVTEGPEPIPAAGGVMVCRGRHFSGGKASDHLSDGGKRRIKFLFRTQAVRRTAGVGRPGLIQARLPYSA